MFQNDYILREIEGLTRFLGKVLFHKKQTTELIDEQNMVSGSDFFLHVLLKLISEEKVNQAENLLHEKIEEDPRAEYLEIALQFYDRVNQMTEDELARCDYSRQEIVEGLEAVREYYVDI